MNQATHQNKTKKLHQSSVFGEVGGWVGCSHVKIFSQTNENLLAFALHFKSFASGQLQPTPLSPPLPYPSIWCSGCSGLKTCQFPMETSNPARFLGPFQVLTLKKKISPENYITCPLKTDHLKKKVHIPTILIFRGYVSFQGEYSSSKTNHFCSGFFASLFKFWIWHPQIKSNSLVFSWYPPEN